MNSAWYFIVAVPILSVAINYQCPSNTSLSTPCKINCSGIVNISDPIPTQCTNLTINAQKASWLTVSCIDNKYCDNMTIYTANCREIDCDPFITNNIIHCIGANNVCNNIEIHVNESVLDLQCATTIPHDEACSNVKIYGSGGAGKIWLQCQNNTVCKSANIKNYGTIPIQVENNGIMNNLNISAPYAASIQLSTVFNTIIKPGFYNNSFIDNRFGTEESAIGTAGFINSIFYFGSSLIYQNWYGLDFHHNILYASSFNPTYAGSVKIHDNKFYVTTSIDMTVEQSVTFQRNDIFANNSHSFKVYMAGINASISNNNIYTQNVLNMLIEIEDDRDKLNDNNFYVNNAENVTFAIYGGYHFGNIIYGENLNKFTLLCLYQTKCGSDTDYYYLSNATFVSINDGDGGIIDGGYFDVRNVDRLNVLSYHGFIQNINVDASFAKNVDITMHNGQLYNSTINASMTDILSVYCISFNDFRNLSNINCNELKLITPPPNKNKKASLLCDGIGCEKLILYTVNGTKDINITRVNCNCNNNWQYDVSDGCIDEWDIYCKHNNNNNNNNTPSIFSADTCDGTCCDDALIEEFHLNDCTPNNIDDNGDYITLIVIAVVLPTLLVIVAISMVINKNKKVQKEKEEALLVQ